jgi:predicted HAD superfamily phosphohydrolase
MFQAQTKFFGSVIATGSKEYVLAVAKQLGIKRSEFKVTKLA